MSLKLLALEDRNVNRLAFLKSGQVSEINYVKGLFNEVQAYESKICRPVYYFTLTDLKDLSVELKWKDRNDIKSICHVFHLYAYYMLLHGADATLVSRFLQALDPWCVWVDRSTKELRPIKKQSVAVIKPSQVLDNLDLVSVYESALLCLMYTTVCGFDTRGSLTRLNQKDLSEAFGTGMLKVRPLGKHFTIKTELDVIALFIAAMKEPGSSDMRSGSFVTKCEGECGNVNCVDCIYNVIHDEIAAQTVPVVPTDRLYFAYSGLLYQAAKLLVESGSRSHEQLIAELLQTTPTGKLSSFQRELSRRTGYHCSAKFMDEVLQRFNIHTISFDEVDSNNSLQHIVLFGK